MQSVSTKDVPPSQVPCMLPPPSSDQKKRCLRAAHCSRGRCCSLRPVLGRLRRDVLVHISNATDFCRRQPNARAEQPGPGVGDGGRWSVAAEGTRVRVLPAPGWPHGQARQRGERSALPPHRQRLVDASGYVPQCCVCTCCNPKVAAACRAGVERCHCSLGARFCSLSATTQNQGLAAGHAAHLTAPVVFPCQATRLRNL